MKNAQLWKRILNEGLNAWFESEEMVTRIITSPIIVDTAVGVGSDPGAFGWEKYKGLAVPFREFWIEGIAAENVIWGMFVEAKRADSGAWSIGASIAFANAVNRPSVIGVVTFELTAGGDLVLLPDNSLQLNHLIPPEIPWGESPEKYRGDLFTWISVLCDTLRLLGCKNIGLAPKENDSKQVARAIKRHGGNADSYRYHVLTVRAPGEKHGSRGRELGIMPRHIARGHHAEYGPEFGKGLLFGKYAGRFYVPPHMRGDKKNGIVEKDYEVRQSQPSLA